jgi:hypothetical protein
MGKEVMELSPQWIIVSDDRGEAKAERKLPTDAHQAHVHNCGRS